MVINLKFNFFLSLKFNNPLYQNPEYIPTTTNRFKEPLFDLDSFIKENKSLLKTNVTELDKKIIDKYTSMHNQCLGQFKWEGILYTPLAVGTKDYKMMQESYSFDKKNLREVIGKNNSIEPEFVEIFYTCSNVNDFYAVYFYICTIDSNPENPTVYSTNEDCHFCNLENEGTLEDFLNTFMTKEELIEAVHTYCQNNN